MIGRVEGINGCAGVEMPEVANDLLCRQEGITSSSPRTLGSSDERPGKRSRIAAAARTNERD